MNIPPLKSPVIAAGIGLLLMGGVQTSALADTTCRADVVFAMDNTGSMGGIIRSTTAAAKKILDRISGGDPRFKGIDVQFAVTTYWGDPREYVGSGRGLSYDRMWYCGPTASYPTRGTGSWALSIFKRYEIYRRYRCDYGTPGKTSDDFKSSCRKWYDKRACDLPAKSAMFVADSGNNRIQKFDVDDNDFILKWGRPGPTGGSKTFATPNSVAVDVVGRNVYVLDSQHHRVKQYDEGGKYRRQWGRYGTGDGQFGSRYRGPQDIAVDGDGNVYVVDYGNNRIQKFSSEGTFLLKWGSRGSGDNEFSEPRGIGIDGDGNIWVADAGNARIKKHNSSGTFIKAFGTKGTCGDSSDSCRSMDGTSGHITSTDAAYHYKFREPWDVDFDSDDNLYVSDFGNNRIVKFDSDLKYVTQWGGINGGPKGGKAMSLRNPMGIAVDDADIVYVAVQGQNRIAIFSSSGAYLRDIGSPASGGPRGAGRGTADGHFANPRGLAVVGKSGDSSEEIKAITAKAYKVNQQLTSDKEKVARKMTEWRACSKPGGCGGDWPEANLFALHQIATEGGMTDRKGYSDPTTGATGRDTDVGYFSCGRDGKTQDPDWATEMAAEIKAGTVSATAPDVDPWSLDADKRKRSCDQAVGWREDAGRVVVWFGDAPSHNTTVTREEAINALNARGIVVAGINTRGKGDGMDTCHILKTGAPTRRYCGRRGYSKVGDPTAVAEATKGSMNHNVRGDAKVVDAILKGVSAGIAQAGSQAMVSFSESQLTSSVHMYVSKFDAKGWTGDLEAWTLNEKTGSPEAQVWSAAALMTAKGKKTAAYSSFKGGGAHGAFRLNWDGCKKHPACRDDFNTSPLGARDGNGESRLDWLLGDTSEDGVSLRKRSGLMGDVWHSSPVFVGPSASPWWDGMAYVMRGRSFEKFKKKVEKRRPVVYVGSNGGPLHAFDAKDGKELFAYYPRSLFSSSSGAGYHHLSEPKFAHKQVYVDGTPVVNDVILNKQWQTLLVGTLANGGRGIFALNITDPEKFASGGDEFQPYLWEFTNEDDPHFGYSQGKPTIALANNGEWVVLVGNGPDGTSFGEHGGTSQLFILKVSGPGPDGVWDLGRDYGRISTGMGDVKNRNGGFSPQTVDLNGDGTIDRAYMGDLYSHIWAFDLTSRNGAKWNLAYGDKPLFSGMTEDDDLHTQPITARPLVTRAPRAVTKWIAGSVSAPPAAIRLAPTTTTTTTTTPTTAPTTAPAGGAPGISLSYSSATSTSVAGGSRVSGSGPSPSGSGGSSSGSSPSGFSSTGTLTPGKTGDGEAPRIMRATGVGSDGGKLTGDGLMIFFGTGRFLSSADKTLTYKQYFYGVHDRGIPDRGVEHLVPQRFVKGAAAGGRITDPEVVVDYSRKSGWYIKLPESGERVIHRAQVYGNLILFTSLVPDPSICASGGHGWEMSVLSHNGASPRLSAWDFDGDGVIGTSDRGTITMKSGDEKKYSYAGRKIEGKGLPSGSKMIGGKRIGLGSGIKDTSKGKATAYKKPTRNPTGRISWMELQPRN